MGCLVANADRVVWDVIADISTPPPPLDLNRWAEENIVFGAESPWPGPYDPDRMPWNREILKALQPDEACRVVTLRGSAQFGKTTLAMIFTVGSVEVEGGYLLYTHPQEDNAKRWAKTKLRPLFRQSTSLTKAFRPIDDNALLYIERRDGDGAIVVSGARSESSLSMISVGRQVQDDLAKWEDNNAGDPEEQADSRSASFKFRKILKASTALIEPGCRITRNFKRGTQEHWENPCVHCDEFFEFTWENLLENLDEEHPERAAFSCPHCGGVIEQRHVRPMVLKGRFVARNPGVRDHRSFHLWGRILNGSETLEDIARKWLAVKGDPKAEQVFFNDWLGLPYEVAGQAPPWEALRDRAEEEGHKRGVVPSGFPLLTIGFDVQTGDSDPRLEWEAVAWGPWWRRAVVDYGVIRGDISDRETYAAVKALYEREWRNEAGNAHPADGMAIDANTATDDVIALVRRFPKSKCLAVRGANSDAAPPMAAVRYERDRRGRAKRIQGRFFTLGVSMMKATLYRQLAKSDPQARGYVALPAGMGDEFFQGLTGERRVKSKKKSPTGLERWRWEPLPNVRNEPLDCMNYAEGAARRLGWWERHADEEWWAELIAEREGAPPPQGQLDFEDPPANAVRGESDKPDGGRRRRLPS